MCSEGRQPIDLVKDQTSDVYDVLRGAAAILDYAKSGNLDKVFSSCLLVAQNELLVKQTVSPTNNV